jgi:glycosyltransferase involved in cell wall biosynthesis
MKKKKIGIFWENFDYGGVGTYLITLLNNKRFKNFQITIFTNTTNKAINKSFRKEVGNKIDLKIVEYKSINVIFFKNIIFKIIFHALRPLLFFLSIIQIYFLLKSRRFDYFISQCGGFGDFRSDFASIIPAKILKYPVRTVVLHHCYTRPKLWGGLINLINYFIAKFCSSFIFVSKATLKDIKKNTPILKNKKIYYEIIHNGISTKKITKRKNYSKNINTIVLSRLEYSKGHLDLIEAFKYLPKKIREKFKVHFVGKGDQKFVEFLKKKVADSNLNNIFKFKGYINEESRKILSKYDLLISPSRDFEGFGLSIAESLSVGVPVISTKVGGVLDYLDNKNSILVKAKSPRSLASSIQLFLTNRIKYEKKAIVGKKLIQNSFSEDKMAHNYVKHLKRVKNLNVQNS